MKERLLFVTKRGENSDEGFSYALELAKTLDAGISVLILHGKRMRDSFEDVMGAVAFAEAGDFGTVKELMTGQLNELNESDGRKLKEMVAKAAEKAVEFGYQVAAGDTLSAIREALKKRPAIEMVLLSPSLSADKKTVDLKKLIKEITRPIVTINRPAGIQAAG